MELLNAVARGAKRDTPGPGGEGVKIGVREGIEEDPG